MYMMNLERKAVDTESNELRCTIITFGFLCELKETKSFLINTKNYAGHQEIVFDVDIYVFPNSHGTVVLLPRR